MMDSIRNVREGATEWMMVLFTEMKKTGKGLVWMGEIKSSIVDILRILGIQRDMSGRQQDILY